MIDFLELSIQRVHLKLASGSFLFILDLCVFIWFITAWVRVFGFKIAAHLPHHYLLLTEIQLINGVPFAVLLLALFAEESIGNSHFCGHFEAWNVFKFLAHLFSLQLFGPLNHHEVLQVLQGEDHPWFFGFLLSNLLHLSFQRFLFKILDKFLFLLLWCDHIFDLAFLLLFLMHASFILQSLYIADRFEEISTGLDLQAFVPDILVEKVNYPFLDRHGLTLLLNLFAFIEPIHLKIL